LCPFREPKYVSCRSQCPLGLRRWTAAARLLWLWIWIPPWASMFVYCECCVLSGRGLCDELITRPEESYRLWCVVVCDPETSWMRRPWPTGGLSHKTQTNKQNINKQNKRLERRCIHSDIKIFYRNTKLCTLCKIFL